MAARTRARRSVHDVAARPAGQAAALSGRAWVDNDAALAAIVRSAQDAVIGKTVDGLITSWNAGATSVYGYTAAEMVGQTIERMLPAAALRDERMRHVRVAEGFAQSGYRCHRLCVDGRSIEVVMSLSPVRDATGLVTGIASISRPVTEGEESDARFASLLEAAPDGMLCVQVDGSIAMANAQAAVLFGYGRDELIGLKLEDLLPEQLRSRHATHRMEFGRNPRLRQMGAEFPLAARRRDGTTFPVEISLASEGVGDKMIIIAAVRDMTAQRVLQAALQVSESHLRQLAEHVNTVFILRQVEPRSYLYVSPAFRRITGRDPGCLLNSAALPPEDLVHPDDFALADAFSAACWAGEACESEFRIIRTDGETRWVRTYAVPVPNPDGPVERVVSSMEDVTERVEANLHIREAEMAAVAANEAKNLFLSRMSHELRTPLNAVLGFGQLLERRLEGSEHAPSVDHILTAGRHLLGLINDVLDISRIESGDVMVTTEAIDIGALIKETTLLVRPLADEAKVQMWITGGVDASYVLADERRLRQVLLNLLSNGIKYNHAGGNVWICWETIAGSISITVRDDGRGVAPEMYARIFTPFDRLGAESTEVEGTGVGLAVTRSLVDLMGGSIGVSSEQGAGAAFTVTLPAAPTPVDHLASLAAVPRHSAHAQPASHVVTTMLAVEDNEHNAVVLASILGLRPAWTLVHERTGAAALVRARAQPPDLVLLDLHLPDCSGFEVLAALKADLRTRDVPVVILTADASNDVEQRLLDAGAFRFFTKPLDLDRILELLDEVATLASAPVSEVESATSTTSFPCDTSSTANLGQPVSEHLPRAIPVKVARIV